MVFVKLSGRRLSLHRSSRILQIRFTQIFSPFIDFSKPMINQDRRMSL